MSKVGIGRPINSVSINGLEYLINDNKEIIEFDSRDKAEDFLVERNINFDGIVFVDAETFETL